MCDEVAEVQAKEKLEKDLDKKEKRIELIESKLSELEARLRTRAKNLKDDLREEGGVIAGNIKAGADEFCEDIAPYMAKYKKQGDELLCAAEKKISDHPLVSVAVAFGAGLLIAALLEKETRGRDRS